MQVESLWQMSCHHQKLKTIQTFVEKNIPGSNQNQALIQNPAKHLRRSFSRKYLTAESCCLFSQKAPS